MNLIEDQSKRIQEVSPLVEFTVESYQLSARLLDDAIDVNAEIMLSLLDKNWIKIELLDIDDTSQIMELPQLENAYFKADNHKLIFLSQKEGRYKFSVRYLKSADKKGKTTRDNG